MDVITRVGVLGLFSGSTTKYTVIGAAVLVVVAIVVIFIMVLRSDSSGSKAERGLSYDPDEGPMRGGQGNRMSSANQDWNMPPAKPNNSGDAQHRPGDFGGTVSGFNGQQSNPRQQQGWSRNWNDEAQAQQQQQPSGWGQNQQQPEASPWGQQPNRPAQQPNPAAQNPMSSPVWGTQQPNPGYQQDQPFGQQPSRQQGGWNDQQQAPQPANQQPAWGNPNAQQPNQYQQVPPTVQRGWNDQQQQVPQPANQQPAWGNQNAQQPAGWANPAAQHQSQPVPQQGFNQQGWQQPNSGGYSPQPSRPINPQQQWGPQTDQPVQPPQQQWGNQQDQQQWRGGNPQQYDQQAPRESRAAYLIMTVGKEPGRTFELRKDRTTIGRSRESDIFVEDLAVSRLHSSVYRDDHGEYIIRDENSANGTTVNGERIKEHRLTDGDEVQTGQTTLKFTQR